MVRSHALHALALVLLLTAAALPAQALPTPGLFCEEARAATGRVFPEAMETNDFISYDEARCGLDLLAGEHPDLIEVIEIGQSFGWENRVEGGRDTFDVFSVEVTNEASPVPYDEKVKAVFMLSIHGNEKGGREGGLRVIEDLLTGQGVAADNPELVEMLDYMVAVFLFPNPDGWVHEEAAYRANDACYVSATCGYNDGEAGGVGAETQSFVRVNGNGVDLNREAPTVGWYNGPYTAMSEPEPRAYIPYLMNLTNVKYATDIHGMLQPADGQPPVCTPNPFVPLEEYEPGVGCGRQGHFVLTMLPAGRQDLREMQKSTTLAEVIKERLNSDPYFAEWHAVPESLGVWGGQQFNDWGTVWDTIGYTDSGFSSDFFAQDGGLNAPGVDFELAYNHITFDNYYPGLAQRINAYHVEAVRVIVEAFMEQTARELTLSVETHGRATAYVVGTSAVTNADDATALDGWAAENAHDDPWDIAHNTFRASPNDYWADLAAFARDGDRPAVFDGLFPGEVTAERLAGYDNLVVSGDAYSALAARPGAVDAVRAWVAAGGNLFVTDAALQLLEPLGAAEAGAVEETHLYAGYTNFLDRGHGLVEGVRGLARQTYEPVPLGFSIQGQNAPVWFVHADAFDGEAVGVAGEGQTARPDASKVNFGRARVGNGTVTFLGALLPTPSEEFYHPYGLDSYATTYTGNQLVRNALGFSVVYEEPPVVVTDEGRVVAINQTDQASGEGAGAAGDGETEGQGVPGFSVLAALAALALAVGARRRRW